MRVDLTSEEIQKIVGFAGYGRPDAPVWFIGLEEGLGDMSSAEAIKNLKERLRFDEVMDLRCAHHKRLWENGSPIDWDRRPPTTPVWTYMAKIMRAYHDQEDCCSNLDAAKEYVKTRLGRSNPESGETFLTELSPIPAAHGKDKQWIDSFQRQDPELDSKLQRRRDRLKAMMKANPEALIICYGSREREFSQLLNVLWDPITPKIRKARGHRHLLLPFLGVGQTSHQDILDLRTRGLLKRA
jgi:hypothetical protein